MNKIWFKRKLYGFGWTPCTWQGWGITASFLILFLLFTLNKNKDITQGGTVFIFNLPALLLIVVFILIIYLYGEKPKWQWGKRIKD